MREEIVFEFIPYCPLIRTPSRKNLKSVFCEKINFHIKIKFLKKEYINPDRKSGDVFVSMAFL